MKIGKKFRERKYRQERISIEQRLRRKQMEYTDLFMKVDSDPERHTGTDPELRRINDEANALAIELIEIKKIIEGTIPNIPR